MNQGAFYQWSQALCALFPEAGPIATMVAVNAVCGHSAKDLTKNNPVLWVYGPPATGKTMVLRNLNIMVADDATPRRVLIYGTRWYNNLVHFLRMEDVLVGVEEYHDDAFTSEEDRERFVNLVKQVYLRVRYQHTIDADSGLVVDTKADRSSLVIEAQTTCGDPMVARRCVELRMGASNHVWTQERDREFRTTLQQLFNLRNEASKELLSVKLELSREAYTHAFNWIKASAVWNEDGWYVAENYVTLLALYNMLPAGLVPFTGAELHKQLMDALEVQVARMALVMEHEG
jgi:hypothetical protein